MKIGCLQMLPSGLCSFSSLLSFQKNGYFEFPHNLTYHGSTCGNKTHGPVLAIQFGHGNHWAITFSKAKDSYQGNIAFTYNTNDVNLFPDAKRIGELLGVLLLVGC